MTYGNRWLEILGFLLGRSRLFRLDWIDRPDRFERAEPNTKK